MFCQCENLQVSQRCDDMLVTCSYGGNEVQCDEIFSEILTDEGLCCIFNGVRQRFIVKEQFRFLSHCFYLAGNVFGR